MSLPGDVWDVIHQLAPDLMNQLCVTEEECRRTAPEITSVIARHAYPGGILLAPSMFPRQWSHAESKRQHEYMCKCLLFGLTEHVRSLLRAGIIIDREFFLPLDMFKFETSPLEYVEIISMLWRAHILWMDDPYGGLSDKDYLSLWCRILSYSDEFALPQVGDLLHTDKESRDVLRWMHQRPVLWDRPVYGDFSCGGPDVATEMLVVPRARQRELGWMLSNTSRAVMNTAMLNAGDVKNLFCDLERKHAWVSIISCSADTLLRAAGLRLINSHQFVMVRDLSVDNFHALLKIIGGLLPYDNIASPALARLVYSPANVIPGDNMRVWRRMFVSTVANTIHHSVKDYVSIGRELSDEWDAHVVDWMWLEGLDVIRRERAVTLCWMLSN